MVLEETAYVLALGTEVGVHRLLPSGGHSAAPRSDRAVCPLTSDDHSRLIGLVTWKGKARQGREGKKEIRL